MYRYSAVAVSLRQWLETWESATCIFSINWIKSGQRVWKVQKTGKRLRRKVAGVKSRIGSDGKGSYTVLTRIWYTCGRTKTESANGARESHEQGRSAMQTWNIANESLHRRFISFRTYCLTPFLFSQFSRLLRAPPDKDYLYNTSAKNRNAKSKRWESGRCVK